MVLSTWKASAVSALLGAFSVLAFAPFEYYLLIFPALALFAQLINSASPKQAAWIGFSFGLGLYLFGVSWVYVSLGTYGGMPLWMGAIAVLGFASLLSAFIAALAYFIAKLYPVGTHRYQRSRNIALPFAWVIFEWAKSWVLTGFPWLDLGYTQTPSWMFAWAPIGGVYLVSFATLLASALLLHFVQRRSITALVCLLGLVASSYALDKVGWSTPVGKPLTVGVVQANIPIEEKWLAANQQGTLDKYRSLSAQLASADKLDLVVWPETALPFYATQTDDNFWRAMSPQGTAVLSGLLDFKGEESFNAAALSCASENGRLPPQLYRKQHLVPFGEYKPLGFVFGWVYDFLQLPMSDFSSWQGHQPLACGDKIKVGLSICYEDAFAAEYRESLGDATVLVNISEDAWFGDSFAPHQRRQMAQMRARELGRPMVRAANSGPSLFINERGQVNVITPQFEVRAVKSLVQPMAGDTPYMLFGNWLVYLSLLIFGGLLVFRLFLSRR